MAANIYEYFIDGVVRRHDVLTTIYRELFVKGNVCGFCKSWYIHKHFLVLFLFKKK